jgi:hypothetical protein
MVRHRCMLISLDDMTLSPTGRKSRRAHRASPPEALRRARGLTQVCRPFAKLCSNDIEYMPPLGLSPSARSSSI